MPRVCSVCVHDRRLEIDRRLIQNIGNYTEIAEHFGLSMQAIRNHAINHLSRQIAVTYGRRELIHNTQMVEELKEVLENAKTIFLRNYEANKDVTALKALDSIRLTLELVARIAAYIHEAKRMEEQEFHQSAEEMLEEQYDRFMDKAMQRLNYSELEMLNKLLAKANGETTEEIIKDDTSPFANIEYNLDNPEYGKDPTRYALESDRTLIDYDKDFGTYPPKAKMKRTK